MCGPGKDLLIASVCPLEGFGSASCFGHVTIAGARDNLATSAVALVDVVANCFGAHLARARPVVPPWLVVERLHGGCPAGWKLHDHDMITGVNFVGAAYVVAAPPVEMAGMVVVVGDGHSPSVPRIDFGHCAHNSVGCFLVVGIVQANLRSFLVTRPGRKSIGVSLDDVTLDPR